MSHIVFDNYINRLLKGESVTFEAGMYPDFMNVVKKEGLERDFLSSLSIAGDTDKDGIAYYILELETVPSASKSNKLPLSDDYPLAIEIDEDALPF